MNKASDAIGTVLRPSSDWLARQPHEDIVDPLLPIVDAHHHLWHRGGHRYLLDELLADTGNGHNVIATVFVDCVAFYREDGPAEMRCIGETEFANGVAAMSASGTCGPTRACAAIVGHADLLRGAAARDVLEAQLRAGNGRFRGIRHAGGWDASPMIHNSHTRPPPDLYALPAFREGFAQLAPLGLSFEAWQYHPQLPMVTALARAFEDTPIVLNHVGGPLGVGPYAGQADSVFAEWKRHMLELARCANVSVKLGGLGMPIGPFDFHRRERPATSLQLADAWRPWIETCIDAFGASRCLFESNFPVDQASGSYAVLWNAFKRLAAGASPSERNDLFSGSARRVYRL
jgi:predicted TIM-barrel fold metal-dependent hydrolase